MLPFVVPKVDGEGAIAAEDFTCSSSEKGRERTSQEKLLFYIAALGWLKAARAQKEQQQLTPIFAPTSREISLQ